MQTHASEPALVLGDSLPVEPDQGVMCPVSNLGYEITRKHAREHYHIHGGVIPPDNRATKWQGARDLAGCNECSHKCVEN